MYSCAKSASFWFHVNIGITFAVGDTVRRALLCATRIALIDATDRYGDGDGDPSGRRYWSSHASPTTPMTMAARTTTTPSDSASGVWTTVRETRRFRKALPLVIGATRE